MSLFGLGSRDEKRTNGYMETIQKGISYVRRGGITLTHPRDDRETQIERLRDELEKADAVVIGGGAGLSTAAGFIYDGECFEENFSDFREAFGIRDIYSGGFYPFPDEETYWAWWSRHIYFNRYVDAPKPVYKDLLKAVDGKDYFVITTNVDHQFIRAGFDKERLFYTQGDYGLFQSARPKEQKTWDNEEIIYKMMEAQGFVKDENGRFRMPEDGKVSMRIPSELIPRDEHGGRVVPNLRADDTFVEDEGWHRASVAYSDYLWSHRRQRVLYLEIGVGANTPVIIKYPFWAMTAENPGAFYACLNYNEANCPSAIVSRSVCINGDAGEIIARVGRLK